MVKTIHLKKKRKEKKKKKHLWACSFVPQLYPELKDFYSLTGPKRGKR